MQVIAHQHVVLPVSPVAILVRDLVEGGYEPAALSVVADWCEQHEMMPLAEVLRRAHEDDDAYWSAYFRLRDLGRFFGLWAFGDDDTLAKNEEIMFADHEKWGWKQYENACRVEKNS